MLEDILAYRSGNPLSDSFSALLRAGLDDDAQLFFLRMAGELADVPGAVHALEHLLTALTAAPRGKTAAWRELYRVLAQVATANPTEPLPGLRAFLAENMDLAGSLAIRELEFTLNVHALA